MNAFTRLRIKESGMKRLLCTALLLALAACGREGTQSAGPQEITRETACSLDGMILADYPGPKAQIHYEGAPPDFFCDTVEMFSIYLEPEQQRRVTALYVQDMGKASWDKPVGHWIDAKTAYYVKGSRRHGSMGPTIASFAREEDALAFAKEYGGQVLRFEAVTPDMADLSGGALHDASM